MEKPSQNTKIFAGLLLLYAVLIFILPANPTTLQTYKLTESEYYTLSFAVRLPIMLSWGITYYGYYWLKKYAARIADTPEGKDISAISRGLGWIAWGLPAGGVITSILNALGNNYSSFLTTALIIGGYIYVVVSLVAFSYISGGSRMLAQRSKVFLDIRHARVLTLGFVILGVLFCVLVAAKLQGGSGVSNSFNSYYMSNGLVWLTIVIPTLYACFIGLLAAFELILLSRRTAGILYKQGLQLLALGLVLIIVSIFALQYFRGIVPRTGSLKINYALIITYGVYIVASLGAFLVAVGAKRLKRIEDV